LRTQFLNPYCMQIDSAGAANILDDLAAPDTVPDTFPDTLRNDYSEDCPDTERCAQAKVDIEGRVDPAADTERSVGVQPANIVIAAVSSQIKLAVSTNEM